MKTPQDIKRKKDFKMNISIMLVIFVIFLVYKLVEDIRIFIAATIFGVIIITKLVINNKNNL
jgi:hypothetical protein